ncbi:MAG TPA: anthranilate phosphoribosyltransferase [Pseudomonadales bacterium]
MSEALTALKPLLGRVVAGERLSFTDAQAAFGIIMGGQATPAQIAAFLVALRMRGETVDEISGAAEVIRGKCLAIRAPANAMDIVGTGGDGSGTLNISTTTAIVVAACGVPVAKHGNRAVSSKSGTADVQTALGINVNADFSRIERALAEVNIGFMLAPRHHESFRHVGPVRAELGVRTIFNILGPLCNPARVRRYLLGVYAAEWVRPLAEVLAKLGCERAWVVHGAGGLDELSTLGPNTVAVVHDGEVRETTITPEDAGLPRATLEQLKGGDSTYNAGRLNALLAGERDAYRDIVLLGAAAALQIADKVQDLREGVTMAAAAIDSGQARQTLDGLIRITNS